ncbi:MAG: hypothetical protein QGI95_03185 [Dehalococcoidales bacterium]|jgi:hypothetical protein|nr:hypothetical protein [Dehalococcoidales bacterium]MDP6825115.1 hypothetical protein [Dehalococcoidales bacterium]
MTWAKAAVRVGIGLKLEVFCLSPVRKNTGEEVVMALIRGIKWKNELDILKILNIVAG